MEKDIIKEAIKAKKIGFNCIPIPEFRDKEHVFSEETYATVREAGCELKWMDTFKGGCFHLV